MRKAPRNHDTANEVLIKIHSATAPSRGTIALHFLKTRNIRDGQKVLICGASGGVGTFTVQIARCFGAKVTGVCSNASLELVKSPGAGEVIDRYFKLEDIA